MFLWVGALKIAAGSAGTATAGALIASMAWVPVAAVAAVVCGLERSRTTHPKVTARQVW
ncbi:hypothetical protein GCM10027055_26560 [Janibacter alkaliphilus]